MYSYFYRFRRLPCHLCFFHFFIFVAWGRGVFFLWFFGVGVVDGFRSVLRAASRFAFRLVSSFAPSRRFALRSVSSFRSSSRFSPSLSFRLFVWACRGSVRVARRFCQLVWSGRAFVLFRVLILWGDVWACRIVDVVGSENGEARAFLWMIAFRVAGRGACRLSRCWAGSSGVCGI